MAHYVGLYSLVGVLGHTATHPGLLSLSWLDERMQLQGRRSADREDASSSSSSAVIVPSAEAALAALAELPSYSCLRELRVWECAGAPCPSHANYASAAGARPCKLTVDGMNFCSVACAKSHFSRALVQVPQEDGTLLYELRTDGQVTWNGPLAAERPKFADKKTAEDALLQRSAPALVGTRLYPHEQTCTREDALNANIATFPRLAAGLASPASHFLAHYDAAGGARMYGMHAPWAAGSKLTAVQDALRQMPLRGVAGGSKAVVFSASKGALELLQSLLLTEFDSDAVAFANGNISQAQRSDEIARFNSDPCCFALLLSVGACAAGLNLTVADHCFLIEPQSNLGKEVRCHRTHHTPRALSQPSPGGAHGWIVVVTKRQLPSALVRCARADDPWLVWWACSPPEGYRPPVCLT